MSVHNKPSKIFIIIPAYNEQKMIAEVLKDLQSCPYQTVIIDDGSLEPLNEIIQEFSVHLLRHKVNLGQGAAIQTGIEYAISQHAEYLVTFDADGQHAASDIPSLLDPLQSGKADIVLGSRFMSSAGTVPAKRQKLLKLARWVNYFFTGLLLSDAHNGLRAMTANAASKIRLRQNGMAHATEIISEIRKKKLRFVEVPVTIHYTEYSTKKGQTVWSGFRIFFDILLNKIFK